jgi:hypothetical protein
MPTGEANFALVASASRFLDVGFSGSNAHDGRNEFIVATRALLSPATVALLFDSLFACLFLLARLYTRGDLAKFFQLG